MYTNSYTYLPQLRGEAHLVKIVINKSSEILHIEIIARTYPRMLDISSIILPSLLHESRSANELEMLNTILYRETEISVGSIINIKITIIITPIFERKYSILAPAVRKVSPTVLPTKGMICVAIIFAALVDIFSDFVDSKVCVEIIVVKMSIINPIKNENTFLILLHNAIKFPSSKKEDANVNDKHTPTIISSEMTQIFSMIDKKTINP